MLEPGSTVRYKGLGPGRVLKHVKRKFAGSSRVFAVIYFPHSDLEAQIPIGDPSVEERVEPLLAKSTLEKLLRSMPKSGFVLPRTWDAREEIGQEILSDGGPREWMELLASYARAEGAGVSIAASDEEVARSATDMLAAEFACISGESLEWGLEKVEKAYTKAVEVAQKEVKEPAEHFSAVSAPGSTKRARKAA